MTEIRKIGGPYEIGRCIISSTCRSLSVSVFKSYYYFLKLFADGIGCRLFLYDSKVCVAAEPVLSGGRLMSGLR